VLGIGHDTNRGHCGKITLDNNMIDILNCTLINAFELDGYSSCFTHVVSPDARTIGIPIQPIITSVAIIKINILF
jgi:hypothetical protein